MVRARKKGDALILSRLDGKLRQRAMGLAEQFIGVAGSHLGDTRERLNEAFRCVAVKAQEHKLADGLRKLVEDRLEFEVVADEDPVALRREVFLAASAQRRQLRDGTRFDRPAFLAQAAKSRSTDVTTLEAALYADLRGAHVIKSFARISPLQLLTQYDLSQQQAVLLRAVQLTAEVHCRDPYAYRLLFTKLKFRRLLHRIDPLPEGGYRIVIDGPFNLFSASTKYGLALALALPSLLACDRYEIRAQLRWGKDRVPLSFLLAGTAADSPEAGHRPLPDEVQAFYDRFRKLDTPWQAIVATDILEVRGAGLCVPDIRFEHQQTGEVAYLEVMGFWSRDAVWKRVELVQAGLPERVIFAVARRLRVSEEVLPSKLPGELYVYKGAIVAREVLSRLDAEQRS